MSYSPALRIVPARCFVLTPCHNYVCLVCVRCSHTSLRASERKAPLSESAFLRPFFVPHPAFQIICHPRHCVHTATPLTFVWHLNPPDPFLLLLCNICRTRPASTVRLFAFSFRVASTWTSLFPSCSCRRVVIRLRLSYTCALVVTRSSVCHFSRVYLPERELNGHSKGLPSVNVNIIENT